MAHQYLSKTSKEFLLDLHGVQLREAERIVRKRLEECHRYHLRTLKCAFGSPDVFKGSIKEMVFSLVQTSPFVMTEELPNYVFASEDVHPNIVFLAIPIQINREEMPPTSLVVFDKFKPVYETSPSQRLLCEMPYQPYRDLYDWNYAARAIGKTCQPEVLKEMASDFNLFSADQSGLSLENLMRSAELFPAWLKNQQARNTKSSIATIEIPPAVLPPEPAPFVPFSVEPDAPALFRLIDRLIEEASYAQASTYLEKAAQLCDTDALLLDLYFRRGRLLSRLHDGSCETWFLQADDLCVKVYGEFAPQRRPVLEKLQQWYSSTGESERVIRYGVLIGMHFSHSDHNVSRERRAMIGIANANLFRTAGHLEVASSLLQRIAWNVVLQRDGELPEELLFRPEELRSSGLPSHLLAHLVLSLALNLTETQGPQISRNYALLAYKFLSQTEGKHRLKAEAAQEVGRITRMLGERAEALHWYEAALAHLKANDNADRDIRKEVNTSIGVVYAQLDEFRQAWRYYKWAYEDAEAADTLEHPDISKLYISMATLSLREGDFRDAVNHAKKALEVLQLKAPSRFFIIGLCYHRIGTAQYMLHERDKALEALLLSEKNYLQSGWLNKDQSLAAVRDEINRVKSGAM